MKNAWNVAVASCVSGAVGFFVCMQIYSGGSVGTPLKPERPAAQQAPLPPGSEVVYKVPVGTAPVKGDAEAKVTIVEFSDFECPFCGRAIEVLKQVEARYGKDVRFAFKHNPLPIHPDAPYASRASIAAGKQGKFWQMHDKLFEANVARTPNGLKPDHIDQMARDLGLDLDRFHRDAESQETKDQVEADQAQARALGANGTPYFYVNGQRIAGAQPFEQFRAVIDAALRRANETLAKGVSRKDLYEALIKDGQTAPPAPPPQPAPPAPAAQARNVDLGADSPWTGAKHAKVTVVEFSDFQCPFCARAEPTLKRILETYKGEVKLVWRNEPLPFHPNALPAAKAAMAAHKQGKFWQMHELMFQHQQELSEAKYEEWAKQIGLDLSRWRKDKDSAEIAAAIEGDSRAASQAGADGTPAFFINGRFISGALPFETFKPVIDEQIEKANVALKKGVKPEKLYEVLTAQNVQSAGLAEQAAGAKIEVGNAPVLGPKNAPVTIVEWSDFQCPFCGKVEPTLQQLRGEYQGKIRLAWKNQPLSFHPNAMPAAEAAMAAHEQGKFWEFHDALFKKQAELGPALYDEVARQLGLDLKRFHASIEGKKFAPHIQADMALGNSVGAQGTPTFFINGKKLVGAQPIDAFKQLIDAELAAAVARK
ncbi:MAG TPA: thioredoxin domain-containing protein [Myxococcales bacterium]|nr:thioredoxin domain-containing protein [Myxococcales bacterium]